LTFLCAVLALLLRDTSNSTLLRQDGVHLIFWFMLAYNTTEKRTIERYPPGKAA
jgi:hypothetical protein